MGRCVPSCITMRVRNPDAVPGSKCCHSQPLVVLGCQATWDYLLSLHPPQGCLVSPIEHVSAIHLSLESGQGPNRVLGSKSGGQYLGGLGRPHPEDERLEHRPKGTGMEDQGGWNPIVALACYTIPLPLLTRWSPPGWVRGGSEEVDTGPCGVLGQDGHHAGRGAEAPRVHADATVLVPENVHHHLCCDVPCQGGQGEAQWGQSWWLRALPSPTCQPCHRCSSSQPARKRALAASMRTGCWDSEKTWAKSKEPSPPHQPWAWAWLRSSGCSAEMSIPMLSWLERFRAPAVEEGALPLPQSTHSVPGTELGICFL